MNQKQELLNNVSNRLYHLINNNNEEEIRNLIYSNGGGLNTSNSNFNMSEFKNVVLKHLGTIDQNSIKNYINDEVFLNENKNVSKVHQRQTIKTNVNNSKKIILNEADDFFYNKKVENIVDAPTIPNNLNMDINKIKNIFKAYDVKNNDIIQSNDVYFALIEIAQEFSNSVKVPSYAFVNDFVKNKYGSKQEISFTDFLNILKELKNN